MEEQLNILLLEDEQEQNLLVKSCLKQAFHDNHRYDKVTSLITGVEKIKLENYDLVLLDYKSTGKDGIEFVNHVINELKIMVPIIFLSDENNREADLKAMESGAQDFLLKQELTPYSIEMAIRYSLKHKKAEEHIQYLAYHDALTGLPNKNLLIDRLERTLIRFSRHQRHSALLFLDLDSFKIINDSLGHSVGDNLLIEVSKRLSSILKETASVARPGGDEFIILLPEISKKKEDAALKAQQIADEIIHTLSLPFKLGDHLLHIGLSIGASLFSGKNTTCADTVLKHADTAMYEAKAAGRNTIKFFQDEMEKTVKYKLALENDLRQAIPKKQFELYYQPQVCVNSGNVLGAEALVRWIHPEKGLISPLDFIPSAEQSGLIHPLGALIFRTACEQLHSFPKIPRISVNISAKQFHAPNFVETIEQIIKDTNISPDRLELELTESAMLADIEETASKMNELKSMGFTFALDDFGTGYSSLTYLKQLPFDVLKIDRSFIANIMEDPEHAGIATAVISLGKALDLHVVGEGVETEDHLHFLKRQGAHSAQGYYISRPVPADQFIAWHTQRMTG
ncbi:hypothetical protein WH96_06190 [Kiloniella spongiae]|uniref:Diguanylate cyclase n=1 Tax=Kiloniella spongiae TaxID=1489064 RepID=A0A0H2MI39_9PROT|nr:GGDEF domain-containing response regulator [Kiloniella spongiae]KLN61866.1 hypothetical protein WH96_06190 [Kiloniella spongiae]